MRDDLIRRSMTAYCGNGDLQPTINAQYKCKGYSLVGGVRGWRWYNLYEWVNPGRIVLSAIHD